VPEWLTSSNVQKLVVVVTGMESNTVLERWVFNVETAREVATNPQYVSRSGRGGPSVCLVPRVHRLP
jgi:hypothetical protein